jgi:hypothetical protein
VGPGAVETPQEKVAAVCSRYHLHYLLDAVGMPSVNTALPVSVLDVANVEV